MKTLTEPKLALCMTNISQYMKQKKKLPTEKLKKL